jgi:hypothetical protein
METVAVQETCEHLELWRARDGWWYCVACSPPAFPAEVVERKSAIDRLFDPGTYEGWRRPTRAA